MSTTTWPGVELRREIRVAPVPDVDMRPSQYDGADRAAEK
jgi:hypothetical protein